MTAALAAPPIVYYGIAVPPCWAHKIRNVLDKVGATDRNAVKAGLHAIMNVANQRAARRAADAFARRWPAATTRPKTA